MVEEVYVTALSFVSEIVEFYWCNKYSDKVSGKTLWLERLWTSVQTQILKYGGKVGFILSVWTDQITSSRDPSSFMFQDPDRKFFYYYISHIIQKGSFIRQTQSKHKGVDSCINLFVLLLSLCQLL